MRIDVHRLSARERRMLLEMLASERSGEDALHIGTMFGRDATAAALMRQGMARRADEGRIVFSTFGRYLAEALAHRIVDRCIAARLAS